MTNAEKLATEITREINYARLEHGLSYYEMFGILEAIKMGIYLEALGDTDTDTEEDEYDEI